MKSETPTQDEIAALVAHYTSASKLALECYDKGHRHGKDEAADALAAAQAENDRLHKQYLAVAGDKVNLRSENDALQARVAELEGALAGLLEAHESGWPDKSDWGAGDRARAALPASDKGGE